MADYSTRGCEAANKAPVPAGPDDAYAGAAWGKGARERPPRRGGGSAVRVRCLPVALDGPLAAIHRRVRGGIPRRSPAPSGRTSRARASSAYAAARGRFGRVAKLKCFTGRGDVSV